MNINNNEEEFRLLTFNTYDRKIDDDIKLKVMIKNCYNLHKKYFENQVVYKNLANHLIEII